jgi:hypothetical protein
MAISVLIYSLSSEKLIKKFHINPGNPACPVAPADLSAFGGWYWGKSCLKK